MQALALLFSPSGRLGPRVFIYAALSVYVAGAASQWLTTPAVVAHAGLWLFIAAQALLVWIWFALHAKRLRDAGQPVELAAGASILYALSIVLLIVIALSFSATLTDQAPDANTASALGLILLTSVVGFLVGSPHHDLAWLVIAFLLAIGFLPVVLAVAVSMWAATRPGADANA